MSNFFRSKFFVVLAIVTVLVLILMAISTISGEKANVFENAVSVVASPVQSVFRSVGTATENFFGRYKANSTYRAENEALKERVAQLEADTRELYTLQNENERLRGLLSLQETYQEHEMIGARVIAKDPGAWYSAFKIDKGKKNGLKK